MTSSCCANDGGFSLDSCATAEMSLQHALEGAVGALFGDDGGEDRWQTTVPVASLPIRERGFVGGRVTNWYRGDCAQHHPRIVFGRPAR